MVARRFLLAYSKSVMDAAHLIKEKLDLAEFLRGIITLMPAGKNWKALCPFHKEKSPSFMVSPERGTWHCFGCNTGGDIFEFVMRYEHLEFFEALKFLAEKAGVDLKQFGGGDNNQFAALYEILNAAAQFFESELQADMPHARTARAYLADRGLKTETMQEFGLGLAPSSADGLTRHLTKLGFRIADVERAGLTLKTERGTYWDRFRGRIMFPLWNSFGKVVAFTGRIMPEAEAAARANPAAHQGFAAAKYVNSPETPLFKKSKLLYGFHKAKSFIREAGVAVLVEGQMDLIMAFQDGVKNVVASSGTALTSDHLKPLRRIADTLVVSFDRDEAGLAAGERVIDLAGTADFVVKVVPAFPDASFKDPADAVRARPGLFGELVGKAEPAMTFYFERYLSSLAQGADPRRLKQGVRAALQKVRTLGSAVEQAYWLRELSVRVRIPEAALMEEMAALASVVSRTAHADVPATLVESEPRSRHERIGERLLELSFAHAPLKDRLREMAPYAPPLLQPFLAGAMDGEGFVPADPAFVQALRLKELQATGVERDPADIEQEFATLCRELKREYYRSAREAVGRRIRACEERDDREGLAAALAEFDRISREMNTV